MGMDCIVKDADEVKTVNETWTAPACELLTDAGEMRLYEEDDCLSAQEIEKLFNEGSLDW